MASKLNIFSASKFHSDSGTRPKGQGATRLRALVGPPPLKLPSFDGLRPLLTHKLQPRAGAKVPSQLLSYLANT